MAFARQIPETLGRYGILNRPGEWPPDQLRRDVFALSYELADSVRADLEAHGGKAARVLCAVVLRGGLLLYPGFGERFAAADFCVLGMQRTAEGQVTCSYLTEPNRPEYDVIVLVDCIAATGATLLAARRILAESCRATSYTAAVICSSERATAAFLAAGVNVVGFSIAESLDGEVVTPDLGEVDAGDLFSGLSWTLRIVEE